MMRHLLPEMGADRHKGDAGRIGVLGGCREYTGAPYFAAISALKVGCDMSHVFCTSEAAPVIKSYSPELIVHPVLDNRNAVDEITQWLPRLHALVVGPGLGRDDKMYYHVRDVIQATHKLNIPIVIDADGLFFVTQYPEVIKGYRKAILTPNAVEFARLYKKLVGSDVPKDEDEILSVTRVGELLDNVTVVRKGARDIIGDGTKYLVCDHQGSPRRCSGQGDLLSGSLGAFGHWSHTWADISVSANFNPLLIEYGPSMCAAYAACWLTRECNRLAFIELRRSTTTTDMITKIGQVIRNLEEDYDDDLELIGP